MIRSMRLVAFVFVILLFAMSQVSCATVGKPVTAEKKEMAPSYVGFSFDLYREILAEAGGVNIFISPASIGFALAMTYNGAGGATARAMASVLGLSGMSLGQVNGADSTLIERTNEKIKGVELSVANSLWARRGLDFKKDFLARAARAYGAQITSLDFSSPQAGSKINAWVAAKTKDKIKDIVDQIDPSSVMFLVNAVYFKGSWAKKFDKVETREDTFYVDGVSPKTHPLMRQSGEYRYLRGDGFQAVSLPYGDGRLSMYVFLPDPRTGLVEFEKQLSAGAWNTWMQSFDRTNGRIALPRFKIEFKIKLKKALTNLGMGVAFDGAKADFSGMIVRSNANAYIYDVVHKTFVDVNEEGTEAAAATSVEMRLTSVAIAQKPFEMIVDHPFFFAIRDNETGLVVFMGSIVDPR